MREKEREREREREFGAGRKSKKANKLLTTIGSSSRSSSRAQSSLAEGAQL